MKNRERSENNLPMEITPCPFATRTSLSLQRYYDAPKLMLDLTRILKGSETHSCPSMLLACISGTLAMHEEPGKNATLSDKTRIKQKMLGEVPFTPDSSETLHEDVLDDQISHHGKIPHCNLPSRDIALPMKIESFKSLGVNIISSQFWPNHIDATAKEAHHHLYFLRKFGLSSLTLTIAPSKASYPDESQLGMATPLPMTTRNCREL
ncbi:uncharacterized protein LOC132405466 [Hypanus sabinus]|uniref:uncharacterized protein LOC132405466 n=1 Tax=Hypanus sabinus TaxID=79690 RepID=UPI0028C48CB7|nr:uncharacterized protein LOC132405466 [Hypanus sabinus]